MARVPQALAGQADVGWKERVSVSFGMIVLNGEPFLRYNLRALYPFAHEIIVVEGAVPGAASIATRDGHSSDGTLETIRQFQQTEDPEGKVRLVTAEDDGHPDGFWPGEKHEQSQAYARRATGEYLWQVDVDEFYQPQDMQAILHRLRCDPEITAVSFRMITFWGGFDYLTDGWYLQCGAGIYHRVFKWRPGYRYVTHRPPTVVDAEGRDVRTVRWLRGETLTGRDVRLYHYSLVFPKQVREKSAYYSRVDWEPRPGMQQWAEDNFMRLRNPYRVHNVYQYPSWLERFRGIHPPQIEALRRDIASGRVAVEVRPTGDIARLLRSPTYAVRTWWLKFHGRQLERRLKRQGLTLHEWFARAGAECAP